MEEIFDKNETRILDKTQATREKLLDGYIEKGINKLDAEDLDVVTKLLDSMDKQIHTNTKIRLAKKDSDTNANYMEMVKKILTSPISTRVSPPTLDNKLSDIKTLPEELSFNREEFIVEDFLRKEDD